jgi:hypothetical protein
VLYLLIVAIGTPVLLCTALLLDYVSGRRAAERHRSALHVALILGRHDEGLRLLDENAQRPHPWWSSTPAEELREIDSALTGWSVVAGYIADHQVDRDVVLDVFGWRVIETWEQAYTYLEDRHPELWEPLLDLYVDAWDKAHPEEQAEQQAEHPAEDGLSLLTGETHAVTPEDVPEVDVVPAEVLAPLLVTVPPDAAAAPSRVAEIKAALRSPTVELGDAPTDLVIDLVGQVDRATTAAPRPVHR